MLTCEYLSVGWNLLLNLFTLLLSITDITKGSSEHRCKKLCHHGDCSVCDGDSIIKCRCRATSKVYFCCEGHACPECPVLGRPEPGYEGAS